MNFASVKLRGNADRHSKLLVETDLLWRIEDFRSCNGHEGWVKDFDTEFARELHRQVGVRIRVVSGNKEVTLGRETHARYRIGKCVIYIDDVSTNLE